MWLEILWHAVRKGLYGVSDTDSKLFPMTFERKDRCSTVMDQKELNRMSHEILFLILHTLNLAKKRCWFLLFDRLSMQLYSEAEIAPHETIKKYFNICFVPAARCSSQTPGRWIQLPLLPTTSCRVIGGPWHFWSLKNFSAVYN